MNPWLQFFVCTAVIVAAGTRLTVDADHLSDRLNLGKAWIGVVLLGVITSLPEAVTSLTAVISLNASDLAVGNLIGSNNINPMIIVMMDAIYRQGSLTNTIAPDRSHKISAGFAVLLSVLVIFDVVANIPVLTLPVGTVSVGMILIAGCYFYGMRRLARVGPGLSVVSPTDMSKEDRFITIPALAGRLFISALLVVFAAIVLTRASDTIANRTGLGGTFFGSIFLALVTSLPEIVVSLSALRLGSVDLAIGNVFGSNMTNIFILFLCGLVHRGGALLADVSKAHILTAALSILLTGIAAYGVFTKDKKALLGLGWDSWAMIVLFVIGTGILYQLRLM